jgi:hypothetical protein
MYAVDANAITSVTFTFSAAQVAVVYVAEFANVDTAYGEGPVGGTGTSSPSASVNVGSDTPTATNQILFAWIAADATVAFSSGPAFTNGTTTNQPLVESNASGTIEDMITGYDLPGSTAAEWYSATLTSANNWAGWIIALEAAGNMDTTAPTGTQQGQFSLNLNTWAVWETGYTVSAQTVAAGTYTYTYSTNAPSGPQAVTATLTFGYSSSSVCNNITAIASWSATLAVGVTNATVSTTTGSSSSIPANSYLCWKVLVTAVGNKLLGLFYDSTTYTTNINTPTISVPEAGLALLGLALVAPIAVRRRRRENDPE